MTPIKDALEAAIRAAKLALFTINKQGIMPNSGWESGFNADLAKAEAGLKALTTPAPGRDALRERIALAEMVFKAVKFADMAAGEGIFFGDPKGLDPADILSDYATAIGGDCWDGMPEAARDAILSALPVAPVAPVVDEAAIRADASYLDFFEKNPGMELSCSWEDDDGPWEVHRVTGGRNDREWTKVGQGETPREAIAQAIRAGGGER